MTNKQNKNDKKHRIPVDVSIHLRYLMQDLGIRGKELLKRYPMYSKASIYRHASKPIGQKSEDRRRFNPGRPKKLSDRDRRSILRNIPKLRNTNGSFTVKKLTFAAGIENVSQQTVRRALHKEGYRYLHSRKKGLLTQKDLNRRLKFARKAIKRLPENFWRHGIGFYFDGAGFAHKYNPHDEAKSTKTMAWRRPDEGLQPGCTARGSHVGSGGRVAHFFVAIAYNKGVILNEQYHGRVNGAMFAEFVTDNFREAFRQGSNPRGKLFLQDGDPSQNSRAAKKVIDRLGGRVFNIPPRSPDMNPIENVFNVVKEELHKQALTRRITFEDFATFSDRVQETLANVSIDYINKTIDSMNRRMRLIVQRKGRRIKY